MRGGGPVPEDRPRALSPLLPVGLSLRPLGYEAAWRGAGGRAHRGTASSAPGSQLGLARGGVLLEVRGQRARCSFSRIEGPSSLTNSAAFPEHLPCPWLGAQVCDVGRVVGRPRGNVGSGGDQPLQHNHEAPAESSS